MSNLTKQQQDVINARKCSLLVSASAGAGKTHTLVERIINLISDKDNSIDIDRLLVVTFTNAAAAEMRQRIGAALTSNLRNGNDSKHLRRQMRLLNKSSISTIHSFCLEIIRQHFHRLEISPSFRVCDELESELIKSDIVEKLLEKNYDRENNDKFLYLVDSFGGQREDTLLQNLILRIYRFSQSTPWPERWLDKALQDFCIKDAKRLDDYAWIDYLKETILLELKRAKSDLRIALKMSEEPFGPGAYIDNLKNDIRVLDDLLASCQNSWQEMFNTVRSAEFYKLKSCSGKDIDKDIQERVKELRNGVKENIKKIKEEFFFRTPEEALSDMCQATEITEEIVLLVKEFGADYKKAKLAKSLVDFSDIEHYALEILASTEKWPDIIPSEAAEELRDRFEEVLVDEYQDINEVQETILKMVSRNEDKKRAPNLLMVGDCKQSIYRFRLAEPFLFQSKQKDFSEKEGAVNRKISLTKNFRSRENVINGVNFIFKQIMTPLVGEMEYNKQEELAFGADYALESQGSKVDRKLELLLVDKQKATAKSNYDTGNAETLTEKEEALENGQLEAKVIAERVKDLINNRFPVYDKNLKKYRPIEYKDIVILLRATKGWADTILEEFRHLNIPAYAELASGYFEAVEVNTIMALLRIIDNPRQDIHLAAVLRSPIIGINAEEMAQIRLQKKQGDFWDAVLQAATQKNELAAKLNEFIEKFEDWRTKARQRSLSLLLWEIYKETGYYDYVGGLPGGIQRQANLTALYDRAKQYESFDFRGVFRFLSFIEAFLEKGQDLGEARIMGEQENVVRVMSIHKSKGLEFPVVIVAGLGKQFNFMDLSQNVLMHKKLGFGLDFIDLKRRLIIPTMAKLAVKQKNRRESLAEEMRILYVAMTRVKEKLILVATIRNLEKSLVSWAQTDFQGQQLPDSVLYSANSFIKWIGPAVIRHKDADALRRIASELNSSTNEEIMQDASEWKIEIINENDIYSSDINKKAKETREILNKIEKLEELEQIGSYKEIINEVFSWTYPYQKVVSRSAVVFISEIKERFAEKMLDTSIAPEFEVTSEFVFHYKSRKPVFIQEVKDLTGADFGTIMHSVMQHIVIDELRKKLNEETIKQQVAEMVKKEVLTEQEATAVSVEQILQFFNSDLGQRLLVAEDVRREVTFTLALPADIVYKEHSEKLKDEQVILRGIIDCMFIENDEFIIVDYKTDKIIGEELKKRTASYSNQIRLYAYAIEKILKRKVKEKHLYFLTLNDSVEIK